jgi:hypothetical protein
MRRTLSTGILAAVVLIAAPVAVVRAQSLHAYDARVELDTSGTAAVRIVLTFDSASANGVRYSLYSRTVHAVQERVQACDGGVLSERRVVLSGALFPALQSPPSAGCTRVELTYAADDASAIPLLVPESKVARGTEVKVEVHAARALSGTSFPRLTWDASGVGRKRLRQVPAVVRLPVARAAEAPSEADGLGFGWTLYGFFVCAPAFIAAFFLWARVTARRRGPPSESVG